MSILYGSPLSPFVRKVAIFLDEKNITYEWKPSRPHDHDPAFQAISPLGKIPAYQDEKTGLADSSIICFYLEKTHPTPALYPTENMALVSALWFEEFFDGGIFGPIGTMFFEIFVNPFRFNKPTDEAAVKKARDEKLPPMLDYLESQLKAGEWLVENRFSIADISVGLAFSNMEMIEYSLDAKKYPKIADFAKRANARPSFQKSSNYATKFLAELKASKPA